MQTLLTNPEATNFCIAILSGAASIYLVSKTPTLWEQASSVLEVGTDYVRLSPSMPEGSSHQSEVPCQYPEKGGGN